jgi:DNA-binding beta-propeller fold protein YncE
VDRRHFLALAAAAPFTWRSALARPPLHALVTCDAEARLAVVDLHTFRVVGSIETHPDPRAVELVGGRAVVCHTAVGLVSVVAGGRVRHVLRDFVEPRYVAGHPDGRHAFVTDSGRSGVVALDVVRGVVVGRVALPGWARHVTIDGPGRRLWVALGSASEHVAVLETARLRRVALLTPGFAAHDVGHAPDGRLWVTGGEARELAVAGVRWAADSAPQHVTFGTGRAYVTSGAAGTFRVLSAGGRVLRTTAIPLGSYNVQHGPGRVITPSLDQGTLTVLNPHGEVLARIAVAGSCHDACFYGSLTG